MLVDSLCLKPLEQGLFFCGAGVLIDGGVACALTHELGLVDPVHECDPAVGHREDEQAQDRRDEGKLGQCLTLLSAENRQAPPAPASVRV